jgi:DNA invertase Pin-like site-specific DNA recombinase
LLPNAFDWQQESASIMQIGYARVSKREDQDTAAQIKALTQKGCKRIFEEAASGGRWDRPELHRLLDQLRPDDVVVVWKLDRLSRSLKDLLLILERIEKAGAGFKSLTEAINTTLPAGRMMMQMLGAFAEFEREMIRERTRSGLRHAREQGRRSGRKPKLSKAQKREVIEAVTSGRKSGAEVARLFEIHPSTVSRLVGKETFG